MLGRRLRKIGSLFGLLAILLSTFAPTVSQTLAAHRRDVVDALLAAYCTASPNAVDGRAAFDGAAQRSSSSTDGALPHLQACAYCGFFAHLPVLPGAPQTFAVTLAAVSAPAEPQQTRAYSARRIGLAQPRAPPAVS
ncbi:MAG TPA: DUF2946 domain-containing protein [Trinickia sp.]|nr:DUF2946 domain-containing protein [Trinickia sp.]